MKPLLSLVGFMFILGGCDSNGPLDIVVSPTESRIYWTDRRKSEIQSVDLNGENIEKHVFGLPFLRDMQVHDAGGKLFFIDVTTERILSAKMDGSQLAFLHELTSRPTNLKIDKQQEKLYWEQDYQIWRSNFDGSMPEVIIEQVSSDWLNLLSIDGDTDEMFWITGQQQSNVYMLMKSDLNGNAPQEIVTLEDDRIDHINTLQRVVYLQNDRVLRQVHLDSLITTDLMTLPDDAVKLHIDSERNQVYWLQNSEIWRTDLASGEASLFFADSFQFSWFLLKVHGNSVFWLRVGDREIYQADLDGANARQVIRTPTLPGTSMEFREFEISEDGSTLFAIYGSGIMRSRLIRVDLATSASETLVSFDAEPAYLYVDAERGGLFWTDVENHTLNRSRLDGSDPVEFGVPPDVHLPGDIKIDATSSKVYWIEQPSFNNEPSIMRSNLDGTAIEQILGVTDGLEFPFSLALDTEHKRLYWTDREALSINAADLDGENKVTLLSSVRDPAGIEVDPSDGKIYWIQSFTSITRSIRRADLEGMNIEVLVDNSDGLNSPIDLELDLVQEKLYWTESETARIRRANLDGSNIEDVVTSEDGLRRPWNLSLALVEENR